MSQSVKELIEKIKYGSPYSEILLKSSQLSLIDTGLRGLNKEKIVFNMTSDIENYLAFIEENAEKINKSDVKEIIVLDSFTSATIEGAKTTVEDVKKAINSKKKSKSDEMVINTINGMNYAIKHKIYDDNIRTLWELVVKNVCENENVKGTKYRDGKVVISSNGKTVHEPCKHELIQDYMDHLFGYKFDNALINECIKHFYFVYIHPFCDGNGRMARIMLTSSLIREYNDKIKYISISNEILADVGNYYKTITESEFVYNKSINITTFIEYMLEVICRAISKGMTNNISLNCD